MDFLKKKVIAWSKLATGGARPLAESVGIDRDFFARVLNNRRPLPDENAIELEAALGLDSSGFKGNKIQSNLARHFEDIDGVITLGFQMSCVAEIRSTREQRGGVTPQKYAAVIFSYGEKIRLSVLRMATDKWQAFCTNYTSVDMPALVIDTDVMPLLNALDMGVRIDLWEDLNEAFYAGKKAAMVEAVESILQVQLQLPEEIQGRVRAAQRLTRKTVLQKLTDRKSTIAQWPGGALEYSKTHLIAPVTEEFQPVNAIGIRRDGKRVFVLIVTMTEEAGLTLEHETIEAVDHVVVFLRMEWDSKDPYHALFDGPSHLLANKKTNDAAAATRYQLSAKLIRDRRFDVVEDYKIRVREKALDL